MNPETKSTVQSINIKLLIINVLIAAIIGLGIISLFVFSVDAPKPEWGKLWMIRPLLITPVSAALGGLAFYLTGFIFSRNGWSRILAIVLGFIVFIIALWLGTVLGLDGTLWN